MKILVFSDTHGRAYKLQNIIDMHKDASAILHLGDGYADLDHKETYGIPVYKVKGNGEEWSVYATDGVPLERTLDIGGKRIFMTHGHKFAVAYGFEYAARHAEELGADILLYGHTHSPYENFVHAGGDLGGTKAVKDLYIFNPGSLGEPRFSTPSYGLVTIKDGNILLSRGEA